MLFLLVPPWCPVYRCLERNLMPKRSTQALTKRFIDSLISEEGKDFIVWDAGLTGFGVRVKPSGRKSYLYKYRSAEGTQRKVTIGSHGQITLEQARRLASAGLGRVAGGYDPSQERHDAKKAQTVSELCDQYMSDAESGRILFRGKPKSQNTLTIDKGRIERHIKPLLGNKRIEALDRNMVTDFMYDVRDGKTKASIKTGTRGLARVRGGIGTAKKSVSLLSAIYNYAIKNEITDANPCQFVEKPADKKRTRFLRPEEYGRLGEALSDELFRSQYDIAAKAITVLALTGCRKSEILGLVRDEIDIEGRCLRLSATKTGAQIRPCGKAALDLLSDLLASHNSQFVFPSVKGNGPLVNIRILMGKACDHAKLEDVTPHTLRHSYATVAHEVGYSELTIAGLLGHRLNSVTSRYAHHVDHVLADAADIVSMRIRDRLNIVF